jgi:hypothetical protein
MGIGSQVLTAVQSLQQTADGLVHAAVGCQLVCTTRGASLGSKCCNGMLWASLAVGVYALVKLTRAGWVVPFRTPGSAHALTHATM